MTRSLLSLLVCVFAVVRTGAQPDFQIAFGGFMNEDPYAIIGTWDNGMVIGGSTSSFVSGGAFDDMYLTKLDRNGLQVWSRHYAMGLVTYALGLDTTSDHGVIVVGSNNSQQGVLLKVDANGMPAWGSTAPINRYTAVDVAAGDTMFTVGYTTGSNKDIMVGKLNSSGQVIWAFRYGTSYSDLAYSVKATDDGGAIVAGSTLVGGPMSDGALIKLDVAGSIEWARTYGLPGYCDMFTDICSVSGGGYVAVSAGCYSDSWPMAIRFDALGDTLWTRRFDRYGGYCQRVLEVNGGFLISGELGDAYATPFLVMLDPNGNVLWHWRLNGLDLMGGSSHTLLPDSSIAMVSAGYVDGSGARDPIVTVLGPSAGPGICGADTSSMQPLGTIWQTGTFNPIVVPVAISPSLPLSDVAPTLYETICGQVGVPVMQAAATTVRYDATRGLLVLGDMPPGHSVVLHDVLGRRLASWRTNGAGVQEFSLNAAPSTLLVAILDRTGALVGSHKVVVVR